jgi:Fe2+ transport system protein FeoA
LIGSGPQEMVSIEQDRCSRLPPNIDTYLDFNFAMETFAESIECHRAPLCPLSKVRAGMAVRIKQLPAAAEVTQHLREIGFYEESIILLTSQANFICLVCNARLAISEQLAQTILVEPLGWPQAA